MYLPRHEPESVLAIIIVISWTWVEFDADRIVHTYTLYLPETMPASTMYWTLYYLCLCIAHYAITSWHCLWLYFIPLAVAITCNCDDLLWTEPDSAVDREAQQLCQLPIFLVGPHTHAGIVGQEWKAAGMHCLVALLAICPFLGAIKYLAFGQACQRSDQW